MKTKNGSTAAPARDLEEALVPLLARLVEAPSGSHERDDVEAAAAILDEAAGAIGLSIERVPDPEGRFADHRVYASEAARGDAPALALVGHVDTVYPRSLGFFGFRREGGDAFGPGVLDMKSGLAMIFTALARLHDAGDLGALAVRAVVVSDEEVGSPSSAPLYARLAPHTSAALVFEHGRAGDAVVTARKGTASFTIEARGRASHAGLAHADGVNAIAALAEVIGRVEAATDYARGITFNVGLVEGGTSTNTVPERARCRVDARFAAPEDGAQLEASLRAAIAAPRTGRLAQAHLTLEGGVNRPAMAPTAASRALAARYALHAAASGLGTGEAPLQGGGSDANLLAAHGVPVIDGLGPAGAGAHQRAERCSLPSLARKTDALARFLADWARSPLL
ncbi:MAG: M20/M25/M40 family metallo-hydrolase [Sandaracinaceae bacterium]|nr:M20/M25/M40 family metallo-hydrolase [Sandaracinaceae bacterium]